MAEQSYGSVERVKLAEDLVFSSFASLKGKFFFETITPNMDITEISIVKHKGFTETNYLELPIPANLILGIVDHTILDCASFDVSINPWTGDLRPGLSGYGHYKLIDTSRKCHKPDVDGFLILKVKGRKFRIDKGSEFFVEILGASLEEATDIKVVGVETNVKAIELE